jgi:hypothetical protein
MRLLIHDMVVGVGVPGRQKEWTVRDHDGIKEAKRGGGYGTELNQF